MKALFNGTCQFCKRFKPRCAEVTEIPGVPFGPFVVCADCRKLPELKGKLRLAEKHR